MIIYTTTAWDNSIVPLTCHRETPTLFFYRSRGLEHRLPKSENTHRTYTEAREFLIGRASFEKNMMIERLTRANKNLRDACKIPETEPGREPREIPTRENWGQ